MLNLPRTPIVDKETGHLHPDWLLGIFNKILDQQFFSISTSGGNVSKALPSGNNVNTELIFLKNSADANTLTITGAAGGNVVLAAKGDKLRLRWDGQHWWAV